MCRKGKKSGLKKIGQNSLHFKASYAWNPKEQEKSEEKQTKMYFFILVLRKLILLFIKAFWPRLSVIRTCLVPCGEKSDGLNVAIKNEVLDFRQK